MATPPVTQRISRASAAAPFTSALDKPASRSLLTQAMSGQPSITEAIRAAAALAEAVAAGIKSAADTLDQTFADARLAAVALLAPGRAGVRLARNLADNPQRVARRAISLADGLAKVGLGSSSVAPSPKDRRFADPTWMANPLLRRIVQSYLLTSGTAEQLLTEAELGWRDKAMLHFIVENVSQALAPSNNPALNPLFWKAVAESYGRSVVRGVRHLASDLSSSSRLPSMVDTSAFKLGTNIAVTPGAVVMRTPVFELIQYNPQTPTVRQIPLLIVPPTINKFYILDIAPGRSIVEYMVQNGQQVFLISWRNPDRRHRDWGVDTYGQAILQAQDAVRRICGTDQTHLFGLCSGAILSAMVAAYQADKGLDTTASLTTGVALLDQTGAGGIAMAALDDSAARAVTEASNTRGYLDGRDMAQLFAFLRPADLVWNYWVNNYLQGRKPPTFDILYWNADTTRMPAKLHRDYVAIALDNALTRPDAITLLGTPVDLSKVTTDTYLIAGIDDHISPWKACYSGMRLFGGTSRFILSTSGHVASMVNPPGNKKATFRTAEVNPPDPDEFVKQATVVKGSWWPDYARWLGERSGEEKDSPQQLGGAGFPPTEPAPGTYVLVS